MIVTQNNRTLGILDGTAPGELIKLKARNSYVFAIVLATDGRDVHLGYLQPIEGITDGPTHMPRERATKCVSFGFQWLLEPIANAVSWPGNNHFINRGGAVHLDENGWHMCFSPYGPEQAPLDFWLTGSEISEVRSGVPHVHWKIWESQADYDHPNRGFLLEFRAE